MLFYEKLNESTRMYPLRLRDCFRNASAQDNFDMKIIGDMMDKYQFGNDDAVRGDFMWKDNIKDGTVVFYPRANGRFLVSYQFPNPQQANSSRIYRGVKIPGNSELFRSGGDTFKFKVTESGKKSLGGGATFMKRDHSIDPDSRPMEEWETHRFVATYLHKPMNVDEYCEDMLMMSVYYGSMMVPEVNVPAIWEHFERRGYHGYLYYAIDRSTGNLKKKPGFNTTQQDVEDIFRAYQLYVKLHGYRISHDDLLEQLQAIDEKMGDYDLFAAGGMIFLSFKNETEIYTSDKSDETGPGITDFMDFR